MSNITAVLILGHGSPVKEANNTLVRVAESVRNRGGHAVVQPAFLQFAQPDFQGAVDILVKKGIRNIIVHPYFLYMGAHVTKDLPFEVETAKKKYPDLNIILVPHLGYHEKLVDVAVERIRSVRSSEFGVQSKKLKTNLPTPNSQLPTVAQHPIEAESFRLISEQLDESKFNSPELPIVKRLIHTTADFEYADLVRFGNNAIETGIDAISRGSDIITDVKMIEVGINKERLNKFGGAVRCFVADKDVAEFAKEAGITKTAAGMRKAFECGFSLTPNSKLQTPNSKIVAIGNAPTALLEIVKMIKTQNIKPAIVIGVPVGFVDAKESKEELMKLNVPYISIKGRKGGSTVAVAIVNALLIMAEEKL
ncbi:MAG: precorrin-8X methylmutase [Deltaproteobacteria bacterium]|nr:precorrin-8X methylmutase [Deltaproteobacteria bacterium]